MAQGGNRRGGIDTEDSLKDLVGEAGAGEEGKPQRSTKEQCFHQVAPFSLCQTRERKGFFNGASTPCLNPEVCLPFRVLLPCPAEL